jgi:hypothetical protein
MEGEDRGAESGNACRFFFGGQARSAFKDELCGGGRKVEGFQLGEGDAKDLARHMERPDSIENAPRAKAGRGTESQPRETIIVERRGRSGCERL